jgi:hypothetical protein
VFNKSNRSIEALAITLPNYQLEVTEYKKPTDASLDGQFSTGRRRENEKDWIEIELFTVATDKGDNNKYVLWRQHCNLRHLIFGMTQNLII